MLFGVGVEVGRIFSDLLAQLVLLELIDVQLLATVTVGLDTIRHLNSCSQRLSGVQGRHERFMSCDCVFGFFE